MSLGDAPILAKVARLSAHCCFTVTKAPVGPHGLDGHHLGKGLAVEEADKYAVWIGDGQRRRSRSAEPIERGCSAGSCSAQSRSGCASM